jgi:hypothetical protein
MKNKCPFIFILLAFVSILKGQDIVNQSDFDNYYSQRSNSIEQNFNQRSNSIEQSFKDAMQGLERLRKIYSDNVYSQEDWDAVYKKAATKFRRGESSTLSYSQGQTTIVNEIKFPDGQLVNRGRFTGAGVLRIEDIKERTQQKEYEQNRESTLKTIENGESQAKQQKIKSMEDLQQQKDKEIGDLQQQLAKIKDKWAKDGKRLEDFSKNIRELKISQSTKDDVSALLGNPEPNLKTQSRGKETWAYQFNPEGFRAVVAYLQFDELGKLTDISVSKLPKIGNGEEVFHKGLNDSKSGH